MRRLMIAAAMLAGLGGLARAQGADVPFTMASDGEARTVGALYFVIARAAPCMPADMRPGYEAAIDEGIEGYRRRGSGAEWVGFVRGIVFAAGAATIGEINGMSATDRDAACQARANAATLAMEFMTTAFREHARRRRGG